jgi:hypothetical protein
MASAADAATWSRQETLNPAITKEDAFTDVSCVSATSCIGIGFDRYADKSFIENWNGTAWSLREQMPGEIRKISCMKSNYCMMVGTAAGGGAEVWTMLGAVGFGADHVSLPLPSGDSVQKLNDISCPAEEHCVVVGSLAEGTQSEPFAETWNGSTWKYVEQAYPYLPGGRAASGLLAVSCTSMTYCVGVGSYENKLTVHADIEVYRGGESWEPTPYLEQEGVTLQGVSCSAEWNCVAVGDVTEGSVTRPVAQETTSTNQWTFSIPATPAEAKGSVTLREISCTSPTSCIAVGSFANAVGGVSGHAPTEERTLAESWNGSAWSVQPSANLAGAKFDQLAGVSCTAEKACTALGADEPTALNGEEVTLGERWNGTWSRQ